MKSLVSIVVSAVLITVGLVSRPSEKATPPVQVVTTELILGGSSKARATNWTFTGNMHASTPAVCVRTGASYGSVTSAKTATKKFLQAISIPARGTTFLRYRVRIQSGSGQASAPDKLIVKVNATVVNTLTTDNLQATYTEHTHDLSALAGTRATIEFTWTFDNSLSSNFCIDDVTAINSR